MAPRIDSKRSTNRSTTWDYSTPTLAPGQRRRQGRGEAAARWRRLSRWPARQKLSITITYRGGAEGWYLVEARGRHGVFPGVAALHDVMREIYQDDRTII